MPDRRPFLKERMQTGRSLRGFLRRKLSLSSNWLETAGYLLFFLIFLQLLTGFLLALYYAPTPDHAWESLYYLEDEVAGGQLLRSLHVWGISWIVVTALLHWLRTVADAAYRNPGQRTWMSGVALFLVLLGFGLTGVLLPWDQSGYWSTVVFTQTVEGFPLLGKGLARIIRGGDEVGALTLTRFHTVHTVVLPFLLGSLAALHLLQVWRYGPASDRRQSSGQTADQKRGSGRRYAQNLFRISVLWWTALVILVLHSWMIPARLGFPADPSGIDYDPRPLWFFLPYYEMVRVLDRFPLFAALILPLCFLAAVFFFPFWVQVLPGRLRSKKLVTGIALLGTIMGGASILYSKVAHPARFGEGAALQEEDLPLPAGEKDVLQLGRRLLVREKCINCHRINDRGGRFGPDLSRIGAKSNRLEMKEKILNPTKSEPASRMPSYKGKLSDEELSSLLLYLESLPIDTAKTSGKDPALLDAPQ